MSSRDAPSFFTSLVSGGVAGTVCDISLYPIDTIKTRLQSAQGFVKSGGFRGVYKGLSVAAVGSAPGAALFFSTYEMTKQRLQERRGKDALAPAIVHMISASAGEVVACLVRVPTEVIKQRMQAGQHGSMFDVIRATLRLPGGAVNLYQGFGITIMREIPFSLIQFPLYERMKADMRSAWGREPLAHEAAICGSLSGAFAAAVTTPLDVLKTRLMLGSDARGVAYLGVGDTLSRLIQEGMHGDVPSSLSTPLASSSTAAGVSSAPGAAVSSGHSASGGLRGVARVLFAGVQPRVMWIGIGGFVFFGAYEQAKRLMG